MSGAESEKLCQSFWTASVYEGETNKRFWPKQGLDSRPPNWAARLTGGGGGGQVMSGVEFYEAVVKVSLSMCSYGGKWGKDVGNQKTLINLGKLEPSVEWNHS